MITQKRIDLPQRIEFCQQLLNFFQNLISVQEPVINT